MHYSIFYCHGQQPQEVWPARTWNEQTFEEMLCPPTDGLSVALVARSPSLSVGLLVAMVMKMLSQSIGFLIAVVMGCSSLRYGLAL